MKLLFLASGLIACAVLPSTAFSASADPASQQTGPDTAESAAERDHWVETLVELTNKERDRHGLPPLKRHNALTRSASWLAADMGRHDYLDHTDFLRRGIDPRIPSFGYTDYEYIGENVAGGQQTPETVFQSWMRSPEHKANILNIAFCEIGVGYVQTMNGRYRHYWVQDFGRRFDTYPLVINNGAAQTHSPTVQLYVYGAGWAKQMRLSNDGKSWTSWEPYRSRRPWLLEAGQGRRSVYVQLRGGEGVRDAQDEVELVPDTPQRLVAERIGSK